MFLLLTLPKSETQLRTEANRQDNGHVIYFDSEFRIPFKLKGRQKKKRKLLVDLVADDGQHGEKLGTWVFELGRGIEDERQQEMATELTDSSTAVLLYRLVVKKRKELSDLSGEFYFERPKRVTAPPEEPVVAEAPVVEEVEPPPVVAEEEKQEEEEKKEEEEEKKEVGEVVKEEGCEPQEDVQNLSLTHDSLTTSLNSLRDSNRPELFPLSVKKQNRVNIRRAFLETLVEQSKELSLIAFNQACIDFSKTVYATFHRDVGDDISPFFVKILENFGVLALPGLTEAQFEEFMEPFNNFVSGFLEKSRGIVELFPLLATIINFGIAIARNGLLYTTAHVSSLHKLESYVDVLLLRLVHLLVASLGPSIESTSVDIEGRRSTDVLRSEVGLFMRLSRQYQLPNCIVHALVRECCFTVDVLIFNSSVSADDQITVSTIKKLTDRLGQIQELFEISESDCLFPNLARFVDTASLFLGTFRMDKLGQPNPFTRTIADRCSPTPDVYPLSFDRLGPKLADREELKVPPHDIVIRFTYEWLFTQEPIKLF